MPRFFFHFQNDCCRVRDSEGIALPDEEAVWYHAFRRADAVLTGELGPELALRDPMLEVEDEEGGQVFAMTVSELFRPVL